MSDDTVSAEARLREVAWFLAYLWEATGRDGKTRVRDLFADDDPIIADAEKYARLASEENERA